MSDREYKISEIKARYPREMIIDKILDFKKYQFNGWDKSELVAEILQLLQHGCRAYIEYPTSELVDLLVEELDYENAWGEIE